MKITFQSFIILFAEAKRAFLRFPLSLICALIAAATMFYKTEYDRVDVTLEVLTYLLGISLFASLTLYFERSNQKFKYLGLLLGMNVLGGFYWMHMGRLTSNFSLLFIQLALAIHLFFAVGPFLRSNEINGFWQFNRIVFLRFLTSVLYATILFGGLCIALAGTEYLFELSWGGKIYVRLAVVCYFIFQTWHFLAGIPRNLSELENVQEYPKELKVLTQYILISLVSLYMVILYLYMARILILGSLPKGFVGWMVSILSVAGIFNLLLLYPIQQKTENRWVQTYTRYFYILILPLIAMLFVGIFKRIGDYGITEARYFLTTLALWLTAISFYFIFSKIKNIKVIPTSLMFLALFTCVGPWGAYQVSSQSQARRLDKLFKANDIDPKNPSANIKLQISNRDLTEIREVIEYFYRNHNMMKVIAKLDLPFPPELNNMTYSFSVSNATRETMQMLKLSEPTAVEHSSDYVNYESAWRRHGVQLSGYDQMFYLTSDTYEFDKDLEAIIFKKDKIEDRYPFKEFAEKVFMQSTTRNDIPVEQMTYEVEGKTTKAKMIFYSIIYTKHGDIYKPQSIEGLILIKKK